MSTVEVARHNDANWSTNVLNLPDVATKIMNVRDTNTTNVVFIIGHVTIPYSGHTASDGHSDHLGAWTADAYYGYIDKSQWTDLVTWPVDPGQCCVNPT